MKYILVSCKDVKSGLFTPPVPFRSDAEAVRAYGEAIPRDPMLSKYPADFELHSVAEWDNESGDLSVIGKRICSIAEISVPSVAASEVAASTGGKFPEVPEEVDQGSLQESAECEPKGRLVLGGSQK